MKRGFKSNLNLAPQTTDDVRSLGEIARREPARFLDLIERGSASGALRLEDFRNWQGLFDALAPVPVKVNMPIRPDGPVRSIETSAFPVLVGTLVIAAMNRTFDAIETIGDKMCEEVEDSKKVSTFVSVHTLDSNQDEVKEGKPFPELGAGEESVEIRNRRNGRKISITAEAISENQMPDIVRRINALPVIASDHVEELTIKRVYDYYGSKSSPAEPYVYRPSGTGTTLYSATANTPGTRAPSGTEIQSNALVDETDLDAARTRLAGMKNNRGTRIAIPRSETYIVVPDALLGTLLKILNSEDVPGVVNERSNWGPRGAWNIPVERVLSSPKIDDISTSCWLYGAMKRQFLRKWKLRMEYVTLGESTQAYLDSRIAFQARIAWDCEVGATDYVYVVRNLAATTAPADA